LSSEETKRPQQPFDFRGTWMPGPDPLLIGGKNFASLGNMVPDPNGLSGCLGYSKITTNPLTTLYQHARSGIQLRSKDSLLSGIFVQAENTAGTASAILQQLSTSAGEDIPLTNDFETTPLHIDAAGAGLGRFSPWPNNSIAYCNGVESLVYAGPETSPAKFVVADAPMTNVLTNPIDYTTAIINNLQTAGNVVRLSAGPDLYTKVFLLFDDQPNLSTTFTDSSYTGGGRTVHTFTARGTAKISTSYQKFGNGCGLFNGTADYIDAPDSADFYLGADPFTLDFQIRFTSVAGNQGLCGQYQDANNYWLLEFRAPSTWNLRVKDAGAATTLTFSMTPVINTYYHFCLQTIATLNKTVIYINGVAKVPASSWITFPDITGTLEIGRIRDGSVTYYFNGRIDGFRLSPGTTRWPSPTTFTPPTTAGRTTGQIWAVFTTRPIQAMKYYLSNINSVAGATISALCWDGVNYITVDITDGTAGMRTNGGVISFASTVGIAAPKLLDGSYYYVYQLAMSDGEAEVYRITVDAPIQPVLDLWDGVLRPAIQCRYYHGSVWIDATMNVIEETAAGVTGDAAYVADVSALTSSEYIDLATSEKACAFKITMYERETGKVNTNTVTLTPYYWNGAAYVAPQGQVDGTSASSKTLAQSGYITWTPPAIGSEFEKTERGETFWRYRLIPSATLSAAVWIDKIEVVSAPQLENRGYKFPFMFQNRAMLCNLQSTAEGNRVDFALTNSTEGWNGSESSSGNGKSALYIGGPEELICACEIYNRLNSSIYTFGLFFKAYHSYILNGYDFDTYKDYPLSAKIGCPAPLTLDTYQVFTSKEQQSSRSIAVWLSFQGPYMFDAGGLTPIPGIECYFDKTDDRCINFAAIETARGWFDADFPQYNLQIPSGTGQTTNNVWLIFDFRENKWYPKIPTATTSPYLCAAVRVSDALEKQYIYGFRDNGHVMRLENGTTWDGEPIEQHVETGEILSSGSIWEIIKMRLLKVVGLPLPSETANLTVTIYKDGKTTGEVLATIPLASTDRVFIYNDKVNPGDSWCFRLRFSTETSSSTKGMQLLAWGCKYSDERTANR